MLSPSLRRSGTGADPRAVVLLLHGGQEESLGPVMRRHASWWRMALMQTRLTRFARENELALWLLRYRLRGWNATSTTGPGAREPDPVEDGRWALDLIHRTYPDRSVVLVGHSMGGRTACRIADDPAVVGVCALAPWLPAGEPIAPLTGRRLAVMHGSRDVWTSAEASRDYVRRSAPRALSATWRSLDGVGHYMFRRTGEWEGFVRASVQQMLDPQGAAPGHPGAGS